MTPDSWQNLGFLDVFKDVSSGNIKTKQGDYLEDGRFPIVDQGKALIGGYSNDPDIICESELPVIVFGDHTRIIKYVDFPFGMGADGVKVLRPRIKADTKFLYYYLQSLPIPDTGYNRHFKYLKQSEFFLPPLAEQQRVAAILDKADALRAKRRAALAKLDTLLQSTFLHLFGDPVTNPMGWEVKPLEKVLSRKPQNGAYYPKDSYTDDSDLGVEMVHMSDVFYETVQRGNLKRVNIPETDVEKYSLDENDILIARRSLVYEGSAKPCQIPQSTEPLIFESSLIRITPDLEQLSPAYMYHYLANERVRQTYVFPNVTRSTISGINQAGLNRIKVLVPEANAQAEFKCLLEKIEISRKKMANEEAQLENLFHSLQQRAFKGEL